MEERERLARANPGARHQDGSKLWEALEGQRSFLRRAAVRMLEFRPIAGVDAEDLVHDALIEASRCAVGFRGGDEPEWRAWLLTVLRTRLSRLRRRAGPTTLSIGVCALASPLDAAEASGAAAVGREDAEALTRHLSRLGPKDRKLLALKYEHALDFKAIAAEMGLPSAGAARKRHLRALERLRIMLGGGLAPC